MAQKSGFFNALLQAGVYDRTYTADDYCDNLAVIIGNGVLRSANDDLKVTASALNLTVNIGRGWINGHYFNNTTTYALPAITTPTGGSRIDNVVLRFDNTISGRKISIEYVEGTAATSPVAPALTRNDTIFELCLAQITVTANTNSVTVVDTRADATLCGWVYSVSGDGSFFTTLDNDFNEWFQGVRNTLASVTLFKQYKWKTTLQNSTNTVQFDVPQYEADTCFFDVFVNGLLADDYTANNNILTFGTTLAAGTDVIVLVYKSIDGTGIMSVADEITQLQNQYATISGASKYIYKATGLNDNISLSQIAQAFYTGSYVAAEVTQAANDFLTALGGNAYLEALSPEAQMTIEVVGKLGVTTPAHGAGTISSRYRYFNIGQMTTNSKRLILDFAKADVITVECAANTANIIFYGTDIEIKNCKCQAVDAGNGCDIQMVEFSNYGRILCTECYFTIDTSGNAIIAENGTFTNCYCMAASRRESAYCFQGKSNTLVRVIGGTFFAYINTSGKTAAVFNNPAGETTAVIMAHNVNCPTVNSAAGYWQQYLANGLAGKIIIDGVVSTMNSTGSYNTIQNQIWQSKG